LTHSQRDKGSWKVPGSISLTMDYRGTHTWFDTALAAYTVRNGGSVNSYIALHSIKEPQGFAMLGTYCFLLHSMDSMVLGSQWQPVPGAGPCWDLTVAHRIAPKHSEREQFAHSLCHFKQGAFSATDGQGIKEPIVWSSRFRKSGSQSMSGRMARRRGSLIANQGWLT